MDRCQHDISAIAGAGPMMTALALNFGHTRLRMDSETQRRITHVAHERRSNTKKGLNG